MQTEFLHKMVTEFNRFSPLIITSKTSPIKWLNINAVLNNYMDALVTCKVEESLIKNYIVQKSLRWEKFSTNYSKKHRIYKLKFSYKIIHTQTHKNECYMLFSKR